MFKSLRHLHFHLPFPEYFSRKKIAGCPYFIFTQFTITHRMEKSGVITIVTGNANKLKEIKTILGESFPYEVRHKLLYVEEYRLIM